MGCTCDRVCLQAPGGPPPPPPGLTEAMLLQQLLQRNAAHPYAVFDPHKQLCVTCEVGP